MFSVDLQHHRYYSGCVACWFCIVLSLRTQENLVLESRMRLKAGNIDSLTFMAWACTCTYVFFILISAIRDNLCDGIVCNLCFIRT